MRRVKEQIKDHLI